MSCAFPSARGDPSPRAPLGLDADERLSLADRIPVFHQPFDDLRGPRRRDRALPAAGDDRAQQIRGGGTAGSRGDSIPPAPPGGPPDHGGGCRPPPPPPPPRRGGAPPPPRGRPPPPRR